MNTPKTVPSVQKARRERGYVSMVAGLIRLVFGLIVGILVLRFVFRLLGANPASEFVSWIYQTSLPFVSPFFGISGHDINLAIGRLELETLIAILVYAAVGSLIAGVFSAGSRSGRAI